MKLFLIIVLSLVLIGSLFLWILILGSSHNTASSTHVKMVVVIIVLVLLLYRTVKYKS